MADLLIRDVAMPKDRNTTLIIYCDGTINLRVQMEDGEHLIPITAKAVSIPEGHGRLIDADGLQEEFKKSHDGKRLMLIDTASTVVPAEGGTDECSEN